MRVRVTIDITRPLLQRKRLSIGLPSPVWLRFSYERLQDFCFCCGRLGHSHKEREQWKEAKEIYDHAGFPFGRWLRAGPNVNGEGYGTRKLTPMAQPLVVEESSTLRSNSSSTAI